MATQLYIRTVISCGKRKQGEHSWSKQLTFGVQTYRLGGQAQIGAGENCYLASWPAVIVGFMGRGVMFPSLLLGYLLCMPAFPLHLYMVFVYPVVTCLAPCQWHCVGGGGLGSNSSSACVWYGLVLPHLHCGIPSSSSRGDVCTRPFVWRRVSPTTPGWCKPCSTSMTSVFRNESCGITS